MLARARISRSFGLSLITACRLFPSIFLFWEKAAWMSWKYNFARLSEMSGVDRGMIEMMQEVTFGGGKNEPGETSSMIFGVP